jgi:hypothetical protein
VFFKNLMVCVTGGGGKYYLQSFRVTQSNKNLIKKRVKTEANSIERKGA